MHKKIDRNSATMKALRKLNSLKQAEAIFETLKASLLSNIEVARNVSNALNPKGRDKLVAMAARGVEHKVSHDSADQKDFNIDGIIKYKPDNYTAPNKTELLNHFKVIHKLWQGIAELGQLEYHLESGTFGDTAAARALLKNLAKVLDESTTAVEEAILRIGQIAQKHLPAVVQTMAKVVADELKEELKGKSATVSEEVDFYASPVKNAKGAVFQFHVYIPIQGYELHSGFATDEFQIVVTGKLDAKGYMTFHIRSLDAFMPPGMFTIGKRIEGSNMEMRKRNARKQVREILAISNILTKIGRSSIPVTTQELESSPLMHIPEVYRVRVKDSAIWIWMQKKVTAKAAKEEVLPEILQVLDPLVGNRYKTVNNKSYKPGTSKAGREKAAKTISNTIGELNGRQVLTIILTPANIGEG